MSNKDVWYNTFTGKKVFPLDPDPEQICLDDIAHALSNICRFTGHCSEFYSVAQHSILVSVYSSAENAMWGLLHDAAEAYLCDVTSPVKRSGLMSGYRAAEEKMMKCIAVKFGLSWPVPEETIKLDGILLMTEARDLGLLNNEWPDYGEPMKTRVVPKSPGESEQMFHEWYEIITWRNQDEVCR